MMKYLFFLPVMFFCCYQVSAVDKNEAFIRDILTRQAAAWNSGNIETYMKAGYWDNDSLLFIGKSGPTYGFKATLERYKRSYPDTVKMGKLYFSELQVKRLSAGYYFVAGKWELKRSMGDLLGYFTLIFRKINGNWRIICDHSS
jgi:hypothetical protein